MSQPILYYSNERSYNLYKKQRDKDLENQLKQLDKNESIRTGELFDEQEAETLAKLYKKTMEKVGLIKQSMPFSLEQNIKRLLKEKEKTKLQMGTFPQLTTPEPINQNLGQMEELPIASYYKPPKQEIKPLKPLEITEPITKPMITKEMINSVLSKFKPIDENKLNAEIKKNSENFKNNSNNTKNNQLMEELKQKLLTLKNTPNLNTSLKTKLNKEIVKSTNILKNVSELEQMAQNDIDVENTVTQVLTEEIKKITNEMPELLTAPTMGPVTYKAILQQLKSIDEPDRSREKFLISSIYKDVLGYSGAGWTFKPLMESQFKKFKKEYKKRNGKLNF